MGARSALCIAAADYWTVIHNLNLTGCWTHTSNKLLQRERKEEPTNQVGLNDVQTFFGVIVVGSVPNKPVLVEASQHHNASFIMICCNLTFIRKLLLTPTIV